nr:secreted protein C isoform X1 [Helicoverpa armigera]
MKIILVFLAVLFFADTCLAQASNYGNTNATNGSTGLVVIDNATFANGAFSNGGSGSGTGSSSGSSSGTSGSSSGSSSGGSSGSNSGNNQSKPSSCGPIKTIISTIIPSLNCSTSG